MVNSTSPNIAKLLYLRQASASQGGERYTYPMAIDITSIRTLLTVNGLGPDASSEEITKMLAAAKYSSDEITSALALLAEPPSPRSAPAPASKVPYTMKTTSYPAVAPVVTEHRMLGSLLTLLLVVLFLVVIGASVYVTSALAHPARWLSMDAFCMGVPPEARDACIEGARPEATPWLEEAP